MARRETAQIIVEVRQAIEAAQKVERVAAASDDLGDEVDEAGRAALRAAAAYELLQRKLHQVTRAATMNAGAVSLGTAALGAMLAVTLGLSITAMPGLIAVLGAGTVAVGSLAAAVIGVGAAAGIMAFAAVQRFKETSDIAGSVASRLEEQAGLLSDAFSSSTAEGATAVLAGLIPLLRGVRGLVHELQPAFTGLGQAMGGSLRWFGEGIRSLGPELAELFGSAEGAFQPLAQIVLTLLSLVVRVGTIAMPYLIDGLKWAADLFAQWQASVTDGSIEAAFSLIGSTVRGIGDVIGGIADVLGPVLGPAAAAMSEAFAGMGSDIGVTIGAVLAAFVQLSQGALPGVLAMFRELGPALATVIDSGAITAIGDALGATLGWIAGAIGTIVSELDKVGLLKPVILGLAAAFTAWKLATLLLNLAMRANPIGMIITVIAGLVLGVIYAYRKFEWFRNIVNGAWNILKSIGSWIAANWRPILIGLTGPIGAAVVLVVDNFGKIKSGITSAAKWVGEKVGDIVGFVKALPGTISSIASGLWNGLKAGLVDVLNWIVGKLNGMIRAANKIPFVDIGEIGEIKDDSPSSGIEGRSFPTPLPGMPGGQPFRRALGGPIPGGGPYRDRVHALLTPGEHVLTRREVARAGGHRGVMQIRSALASDAPALPSLSGALGASMPDIYLTVPVQIAEKEVGRAAKRVELRQHALQGGVV